MTVAGESLSRLCDIVIQGHFWAAGFAWCIILHYDDSGVVHITDDLGARDHLPAVQKCVLLVQRQRDTNRYSGDFDYTSHSHPNTPTSVTEDASRSELEICHHGYNQHTCDRFCHTGRAQHRVHPNECIPR